MRRAHTVASAIAMQQAHLALLGKFGLVALRKGILVKQTERTRLRNHPERAAPQNAADILAHGLVAHVGFIENDTPYVIPMSYHYDRSAPELLYLHGSHTQPRDETACRRR